MNDWEAELWGDKPQPPPASAPAAPIVVPTGAHARYAAKALEGEVARVDAAIIPTATAGGNRNDTLNTAAFSMGQLVGAGVIDENTVCNALAAAARRRQMPESEIASILPRAVREGAAEPRQLPQPATSAKAPPKGVNPDTGEIVTDAEGAPSPDEQAAFWRSRTSLETIHGFAKSRLAPPWTTLGCALTYVITATPPCVVLPPLVGGHGSLNLFVGVVGASGDGKGASTRAASAALRGVEFDEVNLGTGEGIVAAYVRPVRGGGLEEIRSACLFNVSEIDTLTAVSKRQGATVLPVLRSAWSGEALGFQNADAARRLAVRAHAYRATLLVGIQPGRAEGLLSDSDGGTPQRFMWMPSVDLEPDPDAVDPTPYEWPGLGVLTADAFTGFVTMKLTPAIAKLVRDQRVARLKGEGDRRIGGHDTFARIKVAAALAILEGRLTVTDDDWDLSDVVHRVSLATRGSIEDELRAAKSARNRAQGVADAERAVVVAERVEEEALRRVSRKVMGRIRAGGPMSAGELRKASTSADRQYVEPALDRLIAAGSLVVDNSDQRVTRYAEAASK